MSVFSNDREEEVVVNAAEWQQLSDVSRGRNVTTSGQEILRIRSEINSIGRIEPACAKGAGQGRDE
jgi:hypothetical protein